jgi:DNA (cytosine-5)-methyltransferase 1
MRVGSLFAGIGGFDLAAAWMGWSTAWVSEIDPFACAVLAKHFPDAPNHGDITAIDFTTVEHVDILVGGFPCQDISNAGKREGITGERSGLWKEYARAIRELRPRYVVVENVAALKSRGLDIVLGDLAQLGYDAEWRVFGADDVGAPHRRDRLWILAYREWEPIYELHEFLECDGCEDMWCPRCNAHGGDCPCLTESCMGDGWYGVDTAFGYVAYPSGSRLQGGEWAGSSGEAGQPRRHVGEHDSAMGDSNSEQEPRLFTEVSTEGGGSAAPAGEVDAVDAGGRVGNASSARSAVGVSGSLTRDEGVAGVGHDTSDVLYWRHALRAQGEDGTVRLIPQEAAEGGPESPLWPVAHGIPDRMVRLRGVGNAIVPQCAYHIYHLIDERERRIMREDA